MDHNKMTGNFTILENVQHGDDLLCSYPACPKNFVKFRFCGYC